jgi:hypothetical protein
MAKISQETEVYNFVIAKGEDYSIQLSLKETLEDGTTISTINITGYTFICAVKESAADSTNAVTASFSILDATNGIVEIIFSSDDTGDISLDGDNFEDLSKYTYDIFMKDTNNEYSRILCGYVYFSPSISE